MEETSFAIHPEKGATMREKRWIPIGSLISYRIKDYLLLHCTNGFVAIAFYENKTIRIVMNQNKQPILSRPIAVETNLKYVQFQVEEKQRELVVVANEFQIAIDKQTLRMKLYDKNQQLLTQHTGIAMAFNKDDEVICFKHMSSEEKFYGFGEKTGFLNKRGEKLTMWNTDVYAPHNPETDSLYQSIPFFLSYKKEGSYGLFFANTFKTVFDLKSENDSFSFWAEGGQLDYYIFAGPSLKDVIGQYTRLAGRTPLPPKWALGYHQSRYSYRNEAEVREIVSLFQRKKIPISAIHLDIHYMNDYRVFTFHRERFPAPSKLFSELKNMNIRTVTIVDPGVKADAEYEVYQEGIDNDYFCKYIEGDIYFGDVWPGKSAFPDFSQKRVRKWWGEKHRFYTELGVDGIWNDMNEPAVFNESKTMDLAVIHENDGERATHRQLHNLYGLFMVQATYEGLKRINHEKRPFILTRAGYAGIQRYAAVWTGDNRSFWEHLQLSVPMLLNLGLSGVAFSGADVGGFAHDCNGELLVRWTQAAMFMPFFRNHSAIESVRQEPWAFGEPFEEIIKKAIEERYRWLPYLYTLFKETERTGIPIMRPLFLEYEKDVHTHLVHDQFMVGSSVIAAPIMQPNASYRAVYLPKGNWFHYSTDKMFVGQAYHLVKANLDEIPIFIKEGTILPLATEKGIALHLYLSKNTSAKGKLYEDDGESFRYREGEYLEWLIEAELKGTEIQVKIESVKNEFSPKWKMIQLIPHLEEKYESIIVIYNGNRLVVEKDKQNGITIITLPML